VRGDILSQHGIGYNKGMVNDDNTKDGLTLVYDGECPFCTRYASMVRLRDSAGSLKILNAREPHAEVDQLTSAGFNLDDGMVLKVGDTVYHGDEALHAVAMLSSRVGWFNRLNYLVFRSSGLSKVLYPALRAGRNLALKLLGREKIHS